MPNLRKGYLRVRMYRVGFGDCILLSLPQGSEHRHILFDCGVHPSGNLKLLGPAVADVARETGGHLQAVVATHEHADHISGFGTEGAAFGRLTIDEVWMPWAMNPADPTARSLRKKRFAMVESLEKVFAATPGSERVRHVVANLKGNAAAMEQLRSGFHGAGTKIGYFEAGSVRKDAFGVEGAVLRVLGPPKDEKFLKRMDPPEAQRYLRLNGGGKAKARNGVAPFDGREDVPLKKGRALYGISLSDEREIASSLGGGLEALAFTLDQGVNNTSLVLHVSLRGQALLFPGDAQYGSWQSWLESSSISLLEAITFLKVAHHGSHNATPRAALEGLSTGKFAAMVPTQHKPWPSIPRGPLMKRLTEKTKGRVVRSDSVPIDGVSATGPALGKVPAGFDVGPFWADYSVRV